MSCCLLGLLLFVCVCGLPSYRGSVSILYVHVLCVCGAFVFWHARIRDAQNATRTTSDCRYHDVVVNILKDGQGGWETRPADRGGASLQEDKLGGLQSSYKAATAASASRADGDGEFDAQMEHQRLERRSAKYKKLHEQRLAARLRARVGGDDNDNNSTTLDESNMVSLFPDKSLSQRLTDVLYYGLLPHSFTSGRSGSSEGVGDAGGRSPARGVLSTMIRDPEFLRIGVLAGIVIAKTLVADALALYDGFIVANVLRSDMSSFLRSVLTGALFRSSLALIDAGLERYKWCVPDWQCDVVMYCRHLDGVILHDPGSVCCCVPAADDTCPAVGIMSAMLGTSTLDYGSDSQRTSASVAVCVRARARVCVCVCVCVHACVRCTRILFTAL